MLKTHSSGSNVAFTGHLRGDNKNYTYKYM